MSGFDRGHELGRSHAPAARSASHAPARTPEELAADRARNFRIDAEIGLNQVASLAVIVERAQWRERKAALQKACADLAAELETCKADALLSASADLETAKQLNAQAAAALGAATMPRPKPPVSDELAIESSIQERTAHPDDALAWAAGLKAGERAALRDRLQSAIGGQREDGFAVALWSYLAGERLLLPFRAVLENPRRFQLAAYEQARAARVAAPSSAEQAPEPGPALFVGPASDGSGSAAVPDPETASPPAPGPTTEGPSTTESPKAAQPTTESSVTPGPAESAPVPEPSATEVSADSSAQRSGPVTSSSHQPANASGHAPVAPAGHTQGKVKVDFGSGSIKGSIVLTFAHGKTGVPLEPGNLTALKNSTTLRLNGFVHKLETALLNDSFDFDTGLDGVKVALEMSAITAASDGRSTDIDLLKIGVKLVGDVSHWLEASPNVKLTIDGRISVDIGGRLAAKLGPVLARQLEQRMFAKELEEVGEAMERQSEKIRKLKATPGRMSPAMKRQLQQEVLELEAELKAGKKQARALMQKLGESKRRANAALQKLDTKVAKQVAKAMGKQTVKLVAKTLTKLVPVLNLVSLAVDVVELIGIVKGLLEGEYGGSGDGDGDAKDGGPQGSSAPQDGDAPAHDGGPRSAGTSDDGGSGSGEGETGDTGTRDGAQDTATDPQRTPKERDAELATARRGLSPEARLIVDALGRKDSGAPIDADQLTMIDLLIKNAHLTAAEVESVLALLRRSGAKVQSAEDFVVTLDTAVRAVRNRTRTMTVDGQVVDSDPDTDGADDREGTDAKAPAATAPVTTPHDSHDQSGKTGPITSPKQVENEGSEKAKNLDTLTIVRSLPEAIVGRWFEAHGDTLELNAEGKQWRKDHHRERLAGGQELREISHSIVGEETKGRWTLTVTFVLAQGREQKLVKHNFFVTRDKESLGIGAKVGNLLFEGFLTVKL